MTHPSGMNTNVPGAARIWNYWLGGKDNFAADRAAAEAALEYYDMAYFAQQSRHFLTRVVRFLAAEAGIRQFLDIGTGLPTMANTHAIAQSIAPESRIVYVDNDPIVLAHARALLGNTTPEGDTAYVEADYHDPDLIISRAREHLDFARPIAVMFMGVLGHARSFEDSKRVVSTVVDAVPSGSYLAVWDGNDTNPALNALAENYAKSGGVPYIQQPVEHIAGYFAGLELVEPGLVSVTEWRPEPADVGTTRPLPETTGGVAHKP